MIRLVRLGALAVLAIGLLLCWPVARTWGGWSIATATIHTVHLIPAGDGLVRMMVVYSYPAGRDERYGATQGSTVFRPLAEDPLVSRAEGEALAARLMAEPQGGTGPTARHPRVFWRPVDGDPQQHESFILAVTEPSPWRRTLVGIILAILGLSFLLARRPET